MNHSLPASQTIGSLGTTMSPRPGFPRVPDSTRSVCSDVLGTQLLRDDGVSGLLSATFRDATDQDGEQSLAAIPNNAIIPV
jgi:hypothetical protein